MIGCSPRIYGPTEMARGTAPHRLEREGIIYRNFGEVGGGGQVSGDAGQAQGASPQDVVL
jgi:hypothetical protein